MLLLDVDDPIVGVKMSVVDLAVSYCRSVGQDTRCAAICEEPSHVQGCIVASGHSIAREVIAEQ